MYIRFFRGVNVFFFCYKGSQWYICCEIICYNINSSHIHYLFIFLTKSHTHYYYIRCWGSQSHDIPSLNDIAPSVSLSFRAHQWMISEWVKWIIPQQLDEWVMVLPLSFLSFKFNKLFAFIYVIIYTLCCFVYAFK